MLPSITYDPDKYCMIVVKTVVTCRIVERFTIILADLLLLLSTNASGYSEFLPCFIHI